MQKKETVREQTFLPHWKDYRGFVLVYFQHFLRDLLKEAKKSEEVSDDQLIEYTDTMVRRNYIFSQITVSSIFIPMA